MTYCLQICRMEGDSITSSIKTKNDSLTGEKFFSFWGDFFR